MASYGSTGSFKHLTFSTSDKVRMLISTIGLVIVEESLRVEKSLRVGEDLSVHGPIFQRGIKLHADYVFEDEYKLESIREHADFMWKNKHLKAIPKASKDKDGVETVEVGAHRKGIVEELEKAHIYIEKLHKQIGQLKEENKALEERLESRLTKLESRISEL